MQSINLRLLAGLAFIIANCLAIQPCFASHISNPNAKYQLQLEKTAEERVSNTGEKIIPLETSPTQPNVTLYPSQINNTAFKQLPSEKISIDVSDITLSMIFSSFAVDRAINLLVDKNIIVDKGLTFRAINQPFNEVFSTVLATQCLGYEIIPEQKNIHIFKKPDQTNCKKSNNVTDLSVFKKDNQEELKSMTFNNISYKLLLDNFIKTIPDVTLIHQMKYLPVDKYSLQVINKQPSKIFQSLLKAQCFSYRKLTNKSLLIFKDDRQTSCKPLPAGSEIIVK